MIRTGDTVMVTRHVDTVRYFAGWRGVVEDTDEDAGRPIFGVRFTNAPGKGRYGGNALVQFYESELVPIIDPGTHPSSESDEKP